MKKPVNFYSEGVRLVGDVYYPDDLTPGAKHAGVVLCHGYTGVKDLYLPDNARVLTEHGYVVLTFDYKGWGESEGPRSRLAPYSRVADVPAALSFLSTLPEVDAERLGLYGTSYGGATVVWAAAIDTRVKCVVSVVGIGNGRRWMRSVRRPDEFHHLLERARQDRTTPGPARSATRSSPRSTARSPRGAGRAGGETGSGCHRGSPRADTPRNVVVGFFRKNGPQVRRSSIPSLCSCCAATTGRCKPRHGVAHASHDL